MLSVTVVLPSGRIGQFWHRSWTIDMSDAGWSRWLRTSLCPGACDQTMTRRRVAGVGRAWIIVIPRKKNMRNHGLSHYAQFKFHLILIQPTCGSHYLLLQESFKKTCNYNNPFTLKRIPPNKTMVNYCIYSFWGPIFHMGCLQHDIIYACPHYNHLLMVEPCWSPIFYSGFIQWYSTCTLSLSLQYILLKVTTAIYQSHLFQHPGGGWLSTGTGGRRATGGQIQPIFRWDDGDFSESNGDLTKSKF